MNLNPVINLKIVKPLNNLSHDKNTARLIKKKVFKENFDKKLLYKVWIKKEFLKKNDYYYFL